MRSKLSLGLLSIFLLLVLSSCSGLPNGGCTTGCTPGKASLTISLYDTPPTGTNVLSFTLPIAGISLTPSTGSPIDVPLSVPSVEVTRLQTDSAIIVDQAPIAAGTYTMLSVTIGPTSSTNNIFINTSGSTITYGSSTCLNGAVCALPVGAIFTIAIPITYTVAANADQYVGLDFNLNNAITTSGGISVDFSQTGVMTATTTVRTGLPSGSVETMDDFIGVVTAYTAGSSITVQSGTTGVSLTAALTSTTEYDLAPINYSQCTGTAVACVTVGSTVSMDTLVSAAGAFTASEIDVLDAVAVDEVEGVIYPTSTPGIVGLILADKVSESGNATLGASTTTIGSGIFLDVSTLAPTFTIDTKTLSVPFPSNSVGFASASDLFAGQVIRAQVTNVVAGVSGITAEASNVLLRWSRISATVNSVSGNNFTMTNLPSYITTLNTTLNTPPVVATYQGYTAFDGVTGTTDTNFVVGATVAIRALYLNNSKNSMPFQAAKVRVP